MPFSSWKETRGIPTLEAVHPSATYGNGPQDPAELESFLDPILTSYFYKAHIPGAIFLLVKDGKIFFSKGYGYANLEKHIPAGSDTVWRVVSLSKSVTAISVFQLVERGQLNLDEDVNQYLKGFKLPATFPQPVTVRELLNHTAGFDSDVDNFNTQTESATEPVSLDQFLQAHPPARILPPGKEFLYSNAAYDVAGALVEAISGETFANEVDSKLFQPLGMDHSSFQQPPPASAYLAQGYKRLRGKIQPIAFPLYLDPPSRALTTSASDMGRLMLTLLNGGELGTSQVLSPESLRTILSTSYTYGPDMAGSAYGFESIPWGGLKIFSKSGSGIGASSHLVLIPGANLGYFLAYNVEDDRTFRSVLLDRFLEHYFGRAMKTVQRNKMGSGSFEGLTGTYRSTSYSHTTAAKWLRISWTDQPRIALHDGILMVQNGFHRTEKELIPVAPQVFATVGTNSDYVFVEGSNGQSVRLINNLFVYEKVAWYDSDTLHFRILIFFFIIFALGTASFPVAGLLHRSHKPGTPPIRGILFFLSLISFLNVSSLGILMIVLKFADFRLQITNSPPSLVLLVSALLLAALLSLALPGLIYYGWKNGVLSRTSLTLLGFFSFISLCFIPWLNYWNLLGFRW